MALGFVFTQRGTRRTFNDIARHARVESIVTRSISGHLTERMQDHYSTVASDEQREVLRALSTRSATCRKQLVLRLAEVALGAKKAG
jgi:ribosomal protein S2